MFNFRSSDTDEDYAGHVPLREVRSSTASTGKVERPRGSSREKRCTKHLVGSWHSASPLCSVSGALFQRSSQSKLTCCNAAYAAIASR